MTAEVAILNKTAVALAADSAVTTGLPGREKIYTSANKIFTLSKFAPVGAMIYGHIEHCSVPWEVLIKEYRSRLWKRRYNLLSEYSRDFRSFIVDRKFITEDQQNATVFASCYSAYVTMQNRLQRAQLKQSAKNISSIFDDMDEIVSEYPALECLDSISERRFVNQYGAVFEAFYSSKYDLQVEIPTALRARFQHLVIQSLKKQMKSAFSTGLVLAGFGEDEIFPTMTPCHVDGVVFNCCRIIEEATVDISRNGRTMSMHAFAQEDVVNSFLNGVDDRYRDYIFSMLSGFMHEFLDEVLVDHTQYSEEEKNVVRTLAKPKLDESINQFRHAMLDFCKQEYILPVADVLRAAPKDELAHIAESLVSLTSLKRKVSGEAETVGGPVDVALISKGDGFVWIKRKHYFSSELNTHFRRNYLEARERETDERAEANQKASSSSRRRGPASRNSRRPDA